MHGTTVKIKKTKRNLKLAVANVKRIRESEIVILKFVVDTNIFVQVLKGLGTQVRRFKPGRNRRIFKGEKIFSTPSFGGEVKPLVPCRRFAAC